MGGTLVLLFHLTLSLTFLLTCFIDACSFPFLQSWFMAYVGRARILYREHTSDQFPLYRRYHQRNIVSPYRYLNQVHCASDVTSLTAGQVWFPVSIDAFLLNYYASNPFHVMQVEWSP